MIRNKGTLTGLHSGHYMTCEWKKRATGGGASASVVTSLRHALPPNPINALSARVTSSFKQFGSEFPFASYLTLWFMVKRETPKSQNVGTSFRSLSKINGSAKRNQKILFKVTSGSTNWGMHIISYMRCEWKKRTTGGGAGASDVTSLRHALPTHPINAPCACVTSSFRISLCETEKSSPSAELPN